MSHDVHLPSEREGLPIYTWRDGKVLEVLEIPPDELPGESK